MVAVVVIEAYRKIAVELFVGCFAHQPLSLTGYETAEVYVQKMLSGLYQHAHLHRDEIEDPGTVPHLLRQFSKPLHIGTAPNSFNVAGFRSERIFHQSGTDVCKGCKWKQLQLVRIVAEAVEINGPVPYQFPSAAYGILEVAIVAAADNPIDEIRPLFAYIGIFFFYGFAKWKSEA